jgi:hypothetical protein
MSKDGQRKQRRTSRITDLRQQAAGALLRVLVIVGALRVGGDVFGLLVV